MSWNQRYYIGEPYTISLLKLKESHYKHEDYVYEELKKQLKRDKEGWYETRLVRKVRNLPLGNNKNGS